MHAVYMYGVHVLGIKVRMHVVSTDCSRRDWGERRRESREKAGIGALYLKTAPRKRPTLIIAQGIRCTNTQSTQVHNTFLPGRPLPSLSPPLDTPLFSNTNTPYGDAFSLLILSVCLEREAENLLSFLPTS